MKRPTPSTEQPAATSPAGAPLDDGDERLLTDVLAQLEAGQFLTASRLAGRRRPHPYRGMGAVADDRWELLHELVAAGRWLPEPVVRALVDGLRAGDVATAIPALAAFAGADPRAPQLADTLKQLAPQLYQVVGRALPAPVALAPPAPRLPSRGGSRAVGAMLVMFLVLLRTACSG